MKSKTFNFICIIFFTVVVSVYLVLFLSVFYYFDLETFFKTLLSDRIIYSIKLSLKCATISTLISLLIAIPAGYLISRFEFAGKKALDTLFEFPLIVSPSALGAMILIFFSSPAGNWIQENIFDVIFTFYGILVAQVVTTLGITIRLVKQAFDSVPKKYEDVAKSFGADNFVVFFKVTLPNAKRGLLYAGILSFAKSIGEFGATITVAGSMQFKTETLPVGIYMNLSSANLNGAVIMIIILIFISFLVLYFLRFFGKESIYA